MTTETQTPTEEASLSATESVLPYLATKEDVALIPHLATKQEVSRIQAVIPHLATKEDVAIIPHLATKEDVAIIPHLATKEDIAKLETKLVETKNEMLRWTIGSITVATTILGLLIALTR